MATQRKFLVGLIGDGSRKDHWRADVDGLDIKYRVVSDVDYMSRKVVIEVNQDDSPDIGKVSGVEVSGQSLDRALDACKAGYLEALREQVRGT